MGNALLSAGFICTSATRTIGRVPRQTFTAAHAHEPALHLAAMDGRRPPGKRPLPNLRNLPRRFITVFALAILLVIVLIVTLHSGAAPVVPSSATEFQRHMQQGAQQAKEFFIHPNLPKLYNPFGEKAHQPPDQKDSELGGDHWFSDLRWLNPFSSSVTLDADRAVLPPAAERTPIYTYYDGTGNSEAVKVAENELILAWRRAWWAQGFKPIVLGKADARKSQAWYQRMQKAQLKPAVVKELERWLAWHHMGGGILSNWLVFPMAKRDDDVLPFLRQGEFGRLLNFRKLQSGLFCGSLDGVEAALKAIFDDEALATRDDLLYAVPKTFIDSKPDQEALAYYDIQTITSHYGDIATIVAEDEARGLHALRKLINAHLHHTWQSSFPSGIDIVKTFPQRTTTLVSPAVRLSQILSQCSESLDAESCPPNRPSCKPCDPSHPMTLSISTSFTNQSDAFSIVTVAHPYTFNAMIHAKDEMDVAFIRRETNRDSWIVSLTSTLDKKGMFGTQRLVTFKEAVASGFGATHSLWFTAERDDLIEWDWIFGFKLPETPPKDSPIDIQARLRKGAAMNLDFEFPNQETLAAERPRFDRAVRFIKSTVRKDRANREMVEAWNLADHEAWRFVRAYNSRRILERQRWESQEKAYAGAEKTSL